MKKNLVLAFQIILILGFVFIIYTYRRYQNWANKKMDAEIPSYVMENDKLARKKINLKEIYSRLNFEYLQNNFGSDFKNIYYGNEKFNDKFIIYIGILEVLNKELKYNCNINKDIPMENVDSMIKKVFGNITYSNISFNLSNNEMIVEYNSSSNSYKVKTTKCGEFDYTKGGIKAKYLEAYYDNGIGVIEENVYYLKTLINTNGLSYNYYLGIDSNSMSVNSEEKIDFNKVPKYKLVFEKIKDNYYFRYVEKIEKGGVR